MYIMYNIRREKEYQILYIVRYMLNNVRTHTLYIHAHSCYHIQLWASLSNTSLSEQREL